MRRVLVPCIILVLLLSACQAFPVQRKEQVVIPDVKIGTQGIVLSTLPNAPPSEVFEDSLFNVVVDLNNQGAADVITGAYALNIEEQFFSLPRQQPTGFFAVRGKSIFSPQGDRTRVSFAVRAGLLAPQQRRHDGRLLFSACSPYATDAVAQVCVDTDVLEKQPRKACRPAPVAMGGGQGAPVMVTRVETRMLPHERPDRVRPEFVIGIRNAGQGKVVAQERVGEACRGLSLGEDAWGMVGVQALLSDTLLACSAGRFRLGVEEFTLMCGLPEGIPVTMGTYPAPLNVQLAYGYVNTLFIPVSIVKPGAIS